MWRCSDAEPQPSALLDVRRPPRPAGRDPRRAEPPADRRLRRDPRPRPRLRSRSSSPSTPATRCATRISAASIATGTAPSRRGRCVRTRRLVGRWLRAVCDGDAAALVHARPTRMPSGSCPPSRPRVGTIRSGVRDFARERGAADALLIDLALAVTEAVTNSVVHAFIDREPGIVRARIQAAPDELVVVVTDNGRGMQPRADSPGLGLGLPTIASLTTRDGHARPARRRDRDHDDLRRARRPRARRAARRARGRAAGGGRAASSRGRGRGRGSSGSWTCSSPSSPTPARST